MASIAHYHREEAFVKKIVSLSLACLVIPRLFLISCKKNSFKELEYQQISTKDFLQAYVKKKGGDMVLWFQVYDQADGKSTFNKMREKTVKIDNYPAKIKENQWIIMLINNRIEIRVLAYTAAKDFQDTDELKNFITAFDLAGMEKITGPKLDPEELKKFIPKLGGK
jgi:hypothetical protein